MEATQTVALRAATVNSPTLRHDVDAVDKRTIPALFVAATLEHSAQTAMRWKRRGIWDAVSWTDYAAAVREVGCALIALGLQRGGRVAVLSENRPEWLYVDLGAQSVGCISVGIDVSESAERVADILNDCGARVLFVDSTEQLDAASPVLTNAPVLECIVHFDPRVGQAETKKQIVDFTQFRASGRQFDGQHSTRWETEAGLARAADIAIMTYQAKAGGVRVSQRDLVRQIDAMTQQCPGVVGDEQVSLLPLNKASERCFSAYRPLAVGSVLNVAEGPDNLVDALREISPHTVVATLPIWQMLHATVVTAMTDASPLGRLGYRLALDAGHGFLPGRALVRSRVKTMIGLRRARQLLCSDASLPPELLGWYRALGLDIAGASGGEGWRPGDADDSLANKESRR